MDLNNIFWRFLELHLHKIVAVVLFATSVSQISAAYFVLLVLILIVVPLPYFNPLLYPVITVYLGLLSTTKMIFNLPIMSEYYLNFSLTGPCKPIIDVSFSCTNVFPCVNLQSSCLVRLKLMEQITAPTILLTIQTGLVYILQRILPTTSV